MDLFQTAVNIVSDVYSQRTYPYPVVVKLTEGQTYINVYKTMHLDSEVSFTITEGDTIYIINKMEHSLYITFDGKYGFAYTP